MPYLRSFSYNVARAICRVRAVRETLPPCSASTLRMTTASVSAMMSERSPAAATARRGRSALGRVSGGKSSTWITSPWRMVAACTTALCNCRTLPGQEKASMAASASGAKARCSRPMREST